MTTSSTRSTRSSRCIHSRPNCSNSFRMAPCSFAGRAFTLSAQLCLLFTLQQCTLLNANGLGSLVGGGTDKPEITPGVLLPFLQDAANATANVLCALDKQYCPGNRNGTFPSPAPAPGRGINVLGQLACLILFIPSCADDCRDFLLVQLRFSH